MTRRSGPAGRAAALALVCGALTAGCLTPAGVGPPPERPTEGDAAVFSHDDWDGFLARHVDDEGRVDYAAAGQDRDDLDRYLRALAEVSPDSAPERFPEEADRLAYWINAYNATVIDRVLAHHPIASVQDVRAPWLFRWLPAGAGFFVFERFSLGGRKTQLYALENGLIRKRFAEPRIHFALNCASTSCPRLPAEAFGAIGSRHSSPGRPCASSPSRATSRSIDSLGRCGSPRSSSGTGGTSERPARDGATRS